jgi:hypothetical protein
MMSTPQTKTAVFVTIGMVMVAALGVYGWLATSKVSTAAYLSILVSLANTLGLVWNNLTTSRVQQQVENTVMPQVSAIADVTVGDDAIAHDDAGGPSPPDPDPS